MEKLYTTFEIAQMLNVTVDTVRRYMKSGELEAFRQGTKNLVTEEALTSYLDKQKQHRVVARPGSKVPPVTARKPRKAKPVGKMPVVEVIIDGQKII